MPSSSSPPPEFGGQRAFEVLQTAVADAVFIVDPGGTVRFAGPGLGAILGLDAADVEGRPLLDLVHPDDAVRDEAGGMWNAAPPFGREFRMRDARGDWVWVRAQSAALGPGGERPEAAAEALGDRALLLVREQRRDAHARDAHDLLYRALDAADNMVVVADTRLPGCPLVVVNQTFVEATGYAREEVIGRNCRFLQTRPDGTRDDRGDGQAEALDALRTSIETGASTTALLRNYRKDGTLFYNRLFLTPVRDPAGVVTHVIGVQNDVTEEVLQRKRAEDHQRLLQAFFDGAPMMMGVVAADDGAVVHRTANAAARALFGGAAVEGRSLEALGLPPEEVATWTAHVYTCLASGGPVAFETAVPWGARAEGARAVSLVLSPTDGDRGLVAYVGEDVTERRRLEREVLEATAREQERLARDLHDGLGQVLSGAAFRLQALDVQLSRGADDPAAHAADVRRTRQLIEAAHAQARAIARGLTPVDVGPDGLADALGRLCRDASVAYGFDCAFEAEGPVRVGSQETAGHLYRIAQEAISNAARHGDPAQLTVALGCDAEGLELRVTDDGVGIPPEAVEAGRGLGLRTMRLRAEQIGGRFEVGPGAAGGTAVRVRLGG